MKLGLSVKIDVSKIDKARLFQGAKGTYLDLTTFIDLDQVGQYGDNGFICQSMTKEERAQNMQMPILGNVTVFFNDSQTQPAPQTAPQQPQQYQQPQQPQYQQGPAQHQPVPSQPPERFVDEDPSSIPF